jgi:hypothetical protein
MTREHFKKGKFTLRAAGGGSRFSETPEATFGYPVIGKPEFLPGNQALRLHMALKLHWSYGFTLTSLAFATPDTR